LKGLEPTRHGGVRRTGVAQRSERRAYNSAKVGDNRKRPPVLVRWAEPLGLPECPYLIRWRIEVPFGSLRVHHWLGSDDIRAFHDHPWWFITLVLRGAYTDKNPAGEDHLRAGSVRYRPALHRHTVVPGDRGAWTVMITGRPVRRWGFWLNGKFRKANKWFMQYGHHPCDQKE
jgi:hypothetical protein